MTLGVIIFVVWAGLSFLVISSGRKAKPYSTEDIPKILLPEWKRTIHKYVPVVAKMPRERRAELYQLTMRFMVEKTFIGCEGLEVTEDMAVIIASQACLLLLGREHAFYPTLDEVYIYPCIFSPEGTDMPHVGASYASGPVILSWNHSRYGLDHPHDGQNVVLHEFAHQLDQETGLYNGTPIFEDYELYAVWQEAMMGGFDRLQRLMLVDQETVINPYGATGLEEFFAVATEAFFEVPKRLRGVYPRVYMQLRDYYKLDPVSWT